MGRSRNKKAEHFRGRATFSQLLSPKQSWLLSKYFELNPQPFRAVEEALLKFYHTVSESKLALFERLEMVIKELISLRKTLSQHTQNMYALRAEADRVHTTYR